MEDKKGTASSRVTCFLPFGLFFFLSAKPVPYPCLLLASLDSASTSLPANRVPAEGVRMEPE